ncbi:MAG TPA: hypothetical protein VF647_19125 [Longimicrobium sp.]|jgi:hypothetical protein
MRYRHQSLGAAVVFLIGISLTLAPMSGAQSAERTTACSDSAEAAGWVEDLAPDFVGTDEESVEFRSAHGLVKVDPGAPISPVSDAATCSAVAAAVEARLPVGLFPHRLIIVQIGKYYVVPVLDTTPIARGVQVSGRTLTLILEKETLEIVVDNLLV